MPPSKINVLQAVDRKVKEVFHPFIGGDVNDSRVKVTKFRAEFDWRAHEHDDEAFFVLRPLASGGARRLDVRAEHDAQHRRRRQC